MKEHISLPSLGVLTALASSLCCIVPVLTIIAGASGLASTFSWLEPARPYFIGSTVLVLGFAWYQKLKRQPVDNCGCQVVPKASFMQTKTFLSIITVVSALLLSFPSYAYVFFPKAENQTIVTPTMTIQKVEFKIEGMTCVGCEQHVKSEISKLKGIAEISVSYEKGNAIVSFDGKQTTISDISKSINSTTYKAVNHKIIL